VTVKLNPDQFDVDETELEKKAAANHRKRTQPAGASSNSGDGYDEVMALHSGNCMLKRTAILDLGDMAVAVGDEVICTGWKGAIWYAGHVFAQETVGKKVKWVVYFGGDHTHTLMELAPKRYGKAKNIPTKPGDAERYESGWIFVVPAADSVEDGEAVDAATMPGLDPG
jgi:hypothetical protein